MADEQGLVTAVLADWGAPLPRLVLADWLDEQGDPLSTQKARFLRVWCDLLATPVNDLDGYPARAEELEGLKAGLDPDWLAVMEGNRFHLADPGAVRLRVESYMLAHGYDPRHGHRDVVEIAEDADGDWRVRLRYRVPPRPVAFAPYPLEVDRRTGRVYETGSSTRRYRLR